MITPPGICCYCKRPFIDGRVKTREHLIPASKGGNNSPFNIKECCQRCNSWRDNKDFIEWGKEVVNFKIPKFKNHTYTSEDLNNIILQIVFWAEFVDCNRFEMTRKGSKDKPTPLELIYCRICKTRGPEMLHRHCLL